MGALLHRRPRYLALVLLTLVALGLNALGTLGRQEDPTITNLFATVITRYPGADPARVEALVTEKIEARLRELPEIEEIKSVSRAGVSSIQIELSVFTPVRRIPEVWSEIRDALGDVASELPAGVVAPLFDDDRTGAFTAIASITARDGLAAPIGVLSRTARALQERLRQAPNTKRVELYGAAAEEVLVEVDADALAALGLTPADVAAAIGAADAKVAAGRVRGPGADYLIEVAGEIDSLDRVRDTPLAGGPDGRALRVGDVARVTRTPADPPDQIAYDMGRRAVLVAARMEEDRQVDRWAARLRADVEAFAAGAPAGLEVRLAFDQSGYTAARMADVLWNLALGVALVVVVLFVSMGWRSALIVGATLPLTALGALFVLEKLGVVIHQMSVTGLIVALGLLVDAAIVTTDEMRRRIGAGAPRLAAVQGTVRRLATPLAASTATTVFAFLPMATLPGPAGNFVGAIALSVITMLVISFGLALFVTPALAARMLPAVGEAPRWWRDGIRAAVVSRVFAASLDAALRWRGLAMAAAATPAIVGFLALPTLSAQFFPGVERDQFHVQLELPGGASIRETDAAARAAEAILRGDPAVVAVQWSIGRSAPAFYYNMLANRDSDPSFAEALVTTVSPDATDAAVPRLQRALDAGVPQARALVRGLKQGPPVDAPLELRLVGPSLDGLRALGEQARLRMAETPFVTHARAELAGTAPKLRLLLDADAARLAGLTLVEVASQVQALGEGALGGSLIEGPEEMPVRVRLPAADRADAAAIAALTVAPAGARAAALAGDWSPIPLAALGTPRLEPAETAIARRNGERVNTVQGFLEHGVLPDEALSLLQERLATAPLSLPAGYRIEWGGDTDARDETIRNLMSTLGIVVVGMVASIVVTFNSWRLSAVAFVVCGLAMGLSLLALAVFRYPFGVVALIGVIGSVGVSINAAIIILTALQEDAEAAAGDRAAIRGVVMRQGRHIVSTTVTTFGGFLPLILAGGGFWPPFAMAIAGGVLLSTVVSFWFTPPAFSLLAGRRQRAKARPVPVRLAAE
ncbi:efflux RND transporter permease subunit [Rubrimonas sp.]|uniref:efflux RND transporter permease subunit n=1 Tax=Rubrimonas sp. TaxID=2036015 RepID=UPI002FDCEB4C